MNFKNISLILFFAFSWPALCMENALHLLCHNTHGKKLDPIATKKKWNLQRSVPEREAQAAQRERQHICRHDFINCLYDKYETTLTQKIPASRIVQLSKETKLKEIKLTSHRHAKLYSKFLSNRTAMHRLIGKDDFKTTVDYFRQSNATFSSMRLLDGFNYALADLQHRRAIMSALVWASNETIEKWNEIDKVEYNEEDLEYSYEEECEENDEDNECIFN